MRECIPGDADTEGHEEQGPRRSVLQHAHVVEQEIDQVGLHHAAEDPRRRLDRLPELLAREPFSITADEPFVEELTELVTRLAMGGLLQANPTV